MLIFSCEFSDTPQEIITKMKQNLEKNQYPRLSSAPRAITSLMAKTFDIAGFNHTADHLDYSMLTLRDEPKIIEQTFPIVN